MALPPMFLAGVALGALGLILHIVGMATPNWSVAGDTSIGIFKACFRNRCGDLEDPNTDYEAVRAMTVIGCLAGVAGVGLALLFLILQLLGKSTMRLFVLLAAGACLGACVVIIIGVIIYGAEIHEPISSASDLGYSFALCIVGALLLGASGALVFVGGKSLS